MDSFVLFSFAWITSSLSVSLAELIVSPPASSEVKMKVPQLFGYAEDAYRLPSGIAFEDFYRNMTTKYPQMISITSPQYPLPYPVERNTHFKLTVTNSTGMEIFIHKMDIDPLTDFIKLTPLNSDGSERRSVILTGKLKAPIKFRSIGFTTVDMTFGAWTDVNHSFTGFFLSYTPYGNISYTPARIPEAPPELEEVGTISKFLTIPYAQQTKATWHRLKELLAKSANDYINSNRSLTLEMATPDNVTFVYVTKCSDNWPNSVDCIDLEFAIILYNDTEKMATDIDPFMQENSFRVPAGLNSQQLEEMWGMFALKNLEQEGFQLYVLPDLHSEILMWCGLFLGAMVGILIFFVAICRWKLVRNQLIEDDTIDVQSEERKPHDKEVREDEDITMFASPIQMSSEFYQAKESDSGNSNIRRFDMSNGTDLAEGNVQLSNQNQSHGYETITEAVCEDEDEPKSDVLPSVSPGYLCDLLPQEIPENGENWQNILNDVNRLIVPGLTHWQSPNMHGYFPTAASFPSIVGEMLTAGMGVIGFSWICSPACTELEVVVMDWLAKFLKLPKHFLHSSEGPGGGVIQGSASEAVLVAVLAAREQSVRRYLDEYPDLSESEIRGKLIAYSSDQSNSCIEKAGVLAAVPIKLLTTGDDQILYGDILEKAVGEDLANGLFPIICIATLGTTGTCAYDDIQGLAPICERNRIWLHVDAAYAGAAFALEECADLHRGIDRVDSLNFNLHKFLMVNFDCTAMWLKDASKVVDSFNVDRIYLKHKYESNCQIPDYRHWQIPLGRRFRALKVWITFRTMGAEGLRAHVRKHIGLAEMFERRVLNDARFEIVAKRSLGLVCFRIKGDNKLTEELLQRLTDHKKIYLVQAKHKSKHFLRFCICGMDPKEEDVNYAWNEIQQQVQLVLTEKNSNELLNSMSMTKIKSGDDHIKTDIRCIIQTLAAELEVSENCLGKSK